MKTVISFKDILIRTELVPGDIGYVIHLHGKLYKKEYGYGLHFESYVANGLHEFLESIGKSRTRGWVAEQGGKLVGFVGLMDRGEKAQVRYFILDPSVRGVGLGRKLIDLLMEYMRTAGYKSSFLLTTKELPAAIHLYTSVGFKLVSEHTATQPFDKEVTEQRYELTL